MRRRYWLFSLAVVPALALAVSLPSAAQAESHGNGKHGRGHSSEAHRDRSERGEGSGENRWLGNYAYARGGGDRERRDFNGRRGEWRAYASRDRGSREWRGSESRSFGSRAWRGYDSRGSGSREWLGSRSGSRVHHRDRDGYDRADARWRDSGRRGYDPSYRSRSYYGYGGRSYSTYCSRPYYTASFHRPRFVERRGFSLGIAIASVPSYGYSYYDPYCDIEFSDLDAYYDHCCDHGHPEAILVLDVHSGYPIATCAYDDGYWLVDDCF